MPERRAWWAEVLDAYLDHLVARHYSPRTVDAIRWNLERFFSFLDSIDVHGIDDVTIAALERFREDRFAYRNRFGRPDSPHTQAKYIEVVRGLFGWLKQSGRILVNPARDFAYPRLPRKLPKAVLTHDEMKRLLAQPDVTTATGFRDRTLMEVLYSTGLRRAEVQGLELADVDRDYSTVRVREGKGGKDRIVPLGQIASLFLDNYVTAVRPMLAGIDTGDEVFLSSRGRPMSKSVLDRTLKKYAALAGIEKPVSMHTFRRSFATGLLLGGAKAAHVKDMLGHSSFVSLAAYVNLTIKDLRESHAKHHPRERDQEHDDQGEERDM